MRLLGGWPALLEGGEQGQHCSSEPAVAGLAPGAMDGRVVVARTAEAASAWCGELQATPLSAVALWVELAGGGPVAARRSPLAVGIAAWTLHGSVVSAVLDLREARVAPALGLVLGLQVPLVAHDLKPLLLGLWSLGLRESAIPYDTRLAAACLLLGRPHARATRPAGAPPDALVRHEIEVEAEREHLLSLEAQCERQGIPLEFPAAATDRLEGIDARMLAGRAAWTIRLYAAQQADLLRHGLHSHLHTIEFPFAVANARMEWRGLPVDRVRAVQLADTLRERREDLARRLKEYGIERPQSREDFLEAMARAGLADRFLRHGSPCADDEILRAREGLHTAVRLFRLHRRYGQWEREVRLMAAGATPDGRVHPEHRQLAAATGRSSCRNPNVVGLSRAFRPLVKAPPGRALLELDYSQIEVGIAAAEHGDLDLVRAYNAGDVYSTVAQELFADELEEKERDLHPLAFQRARADLRERAKTFVLSVLYDVQPRTIAQELGVTEARAASYRRRFLSLFPRLAARLEESAAVGIARGYATVVSGLRREVDRSTTDWSWTRRWLRNTPVQGSAAVVFKKALVDLDRAFRGTDVWIVLAIHDGVLIECPMDARREVAERAAGIMREALRAYYPDLEPRVAVNADHPECWHVPGQPDSLQRFLEVPEYRVEAARPRRRPPYARWRCSICRPDSPAELEWEVELAA